MTPEEEVDQLKKKNVELLQEQSNAVKQWHDEVRKSLNNLTSEVAGIKMNTTDLPQIRANQEALGVRVRYLEDFKILIICALVMLAFVLALSVVFYVEWRLKRG